MVWMKGGVDRRSWLLFLSIYCIAVLPAFWDRCTTAPSPLVPSFGAPSTQPTTSAAFSFWDFPFFRLLPACDREDPNGRSLSCPVRASKGQHADVSQRRRTKTSDGHVADARQDDAAGSWLRVAWQTMVTICAPTIPRDRPMLFTAALSTAEKHRYRYLLTLPSFSPFKGRRARSKAIPSIVLTPLFLHLGTKHGQ